MTTSNVKTAVAAVGEKSAAVSNKVEGLYAPLAEELFALGLTPMCAAKGGEHRGALMTGFLVGWQGAEFAEQFVSAKPKDLLSGTVMGQKGRTRTVEKPKSAWLTHANNSLDRLVSAFSDLYWQEIAIKREQESGASRDDAEQKVKAQRAEKEKVKTRTPIEVMAGNVDSITRRLTAIKDGTAKGSDAKVLGDVTEALKASRELLKALKALG